MLRGTAATFAGFVLVFAGCLFPELPLIAEDAGSDAANDGSVDGPPLDARMCTASTIVCDDASGIYLECSAQGMPIIERACPLGCASGVERCLDVDPSNGLASALDSTDTAPAITFVGDSTLDTSTGAATNNGVAIVVPSLTINGIRAFAFRSVRVEGTLRVTGTAPVAIVVDGDVEIVGLLNVSASGATAGPGATTTGTCIGGFYSAFEVGTNGVGGGGGGRDTRGANGGANGAGHIGGDGGAPLQDGDLSPLTGGCSGGEGQERSGGVFAHALGGGGGGAIQIVSRTRILLSGSGVIDASGGGGQSAPPVGTDTSVAGGGGGSGGAILLEAPIVTMTGATVALSTKGGGGAAAGNGTMAIAGADGGATSSAASGGVNGNLAAGGSGGTELVSPVVGAAGVGPATDGGGGGGAVGQARVNTRPSMFTRLDGAAVRSGLTTGVIGSRVEP